MGYRYGAPIWGADMGHGYVGRWLWGAGMGAGMGRRYEGRWLWGIDMGHGYGGDGYGVSIWGEAAMGRR